MKQNLLINILLFVSLSISGQIGVNTNNPHQSAALDVTSTTKGFLIPSMSELNKNQINKPAHGLFVYDTTLKCLSINTGTETAPIWTCNNMYDKQFFYMPSINIDTDELNVEKKLDLYAQYQTEFANPMVRSVPLTTPASIPTYDRNQLFYYITDYDPNLINIASIDASGNMTYTVKKHADFDTYMNIVFVVK